MDAFTVRGDICLMQLFLLDMVIVGALSAGYQYDRGELCVALFTVRGTICIKFFCFVLFLGGGLFVAVFTVKGTVLYIAESSNWM